MIFICWLYRKLQFAVHREVLILIGLKGAPLGYFAFLTPGCAHFDRSFGIIYIIPIQGFMIAIRYFLSL